MKNKDFINLLKDVEETGFFSIYACHENLEHFRKYKILKENLVIKNSVIGDNFYCDKCRTYERFTAETTNKYQIPENKFLLKCSKYLHSDKHLFLDVKELKKYISDLPTLSVFFSNVMNIKLHNNIYHPIYFKYISYYKLSQDNFLILKKSEDDRLIYFFNKKRKINIKNCFFFDENSNKFCVSDKLNNFIKH